MHTVDSVTQLYAFYYTPSPPLSISDGWNLYSPREEFGRMGVGSRSKAWRFTDINKDYTVRSLPPVRLAIFICNASASLSSSSVPHTLPVSSCRPKSATRRCSTASSTAARAAYPPLRTCTGQTS